MNKEMGQQFNNEQLPDRLTTENAEAKKDQKRSLEKLDHAFKTLLNMEGHSIIIEKNNDNKDEEKNISGDAASLYVLTFIENEENPKLVKIGWGEFNKKAFQDEKFRNLPFDVYCVGQNESYLANEKLKKEMKDNPKKYLSEHSIFVANGGKVELSSENKSGKRHLKKEIKPIPYNEMLRTVRNQIVKTRTTPEEFAAFLHELPEDSDKLGDEMTKLYNIPWMNRRELKMADEKTKAIAKKKDLMHLLWGMGVEQVGIAVGDKKAMESILALKNSFDFRTNSFKQ